MNFPQSSFVRRAPQYWRKIEGILSSGGIPLSGNQRRLKSLMNRHAGEKAVVIGMGPSLLPEDLERFDGFTTFACNKIYLNFERSCWRPDYYSVNDVLVAANNRDAILSADFGKCQPLHSCIVASELGSHREPIIYHYLRSLMHLTEDSDPNFLRSLQLGIRSGGCSICIDQIQLAYLMGFTEVYLVGIDFSFQVDQLKSVGASASGKVLESVGERNHFHKDYRKKGESWTVPRLEEQRNAFMQCRRLFDASGRKLLNASRLTKLDVLDRIDFDSCFPRGDRVHT